MNFSLYLRACCCRRIIAISFLIVCGLFYNISFSQAAAPTHRVRPGDTVYSILQQNQFSKDQRSHALAEARLPKSFVLSPGQPYFIQKKVGRLTITFFSNETPDMFTFWRDGVTRAGAETSSANFDTQIKKASGKIRGSLVESIAAVTGDDLVGYRFMDAFVLDFDLPRLLQRGAQFSLSFEKLYHNGLFIRNGNVLTASIEINDKIIERRFVKISDGGVFMDLRNRHEDRPFFSPVNDVRISSLFQPRRIHPIKKRARAHLGIDFEAASGAPIFSVGTGQILRVGRNRAAGNYVVIKHSDGYETYYNHMNQLDSTLYKGKSIAAGEKLGAIGCTGYCTKPHLHFAVKKHGRFINPIRLLRFYSFKQRHTVQSLIADNRY